MTAKNNQRLKSQRGIAMMVALLALLLLAAIGMGLMFMADTENSVNNNYRDSQKAYFAARAGAENVRMLLGNGGSLNPSATALTMPSSAANGGVLYVLNPAGGEAVNPTTAAGATVADNAYMDDQLCWEKFTGLNTLSVPAAGPCVNGTSTTQLLSSAASYKTTTLAASPGIVGSDALPFKWVRITNKQNLMGTLNSAAAKVNPALANGLQVCWNGTSEVPITAGTCDTQFPQQMTPVWMLTSLAVTPKIGANPGSRRIVQMEVALAPPINPPGPVAAQAPINLQGNLQVNGYDNCSCTSANANRAGKTCDGSHLAVFSANGVSQTGNAATLTSGQGNNMTTYNADGSVHTQGATAQNQPWPYDVNQMISDYKKTAQNAGGAPWNYSCSGTPSNCGTQTGDNFGEFPTGLPDNPSFTGTGPATVYVPGSVHLSGNTSGSGILIIDGDLEVHGGLAFYGLILVKGQISFTGGGHQNINLYGAILAGEDVNAQDVALIDTIGGSFSFHYDKCALQLFPSNGPPKMLATHEIMY